METHSEVSKFYHNQALKHPKNFKNLPHKSSNTKNINPIILPSLRVLMELNFKTSKIFKDFNPLTLHRIQVLKPLITSTTNLRKSKSSEKHTKNMKNKKSLLSAKPKINCSSITKIFNLSSIQSGRHLCLNQYCIGITSRGLLCCNII